MENDSDERVVVEVTSTNKEVSVTDATVNVEPAFSVCVPPFWPKEVELWIFLLENQFKLARITDDEKKFSITVTNIELQYLSQVLNIFSDLPATGRYEWLKKELIKKFTDSDRIKTQKFLDDKKIGDRTPSQFYWDLRKLAPKSVSNNFVLTVWKIRLPENIQCILAAVSVNEVTTLTRVADEIHEIHCHEEQMLAKNAKQNATNSEQQPPVLSIEDRLTQIKAQINALSLNNWHQPGSPSRRRGSHSSKRDQLDRLCYYHETFRDQARKCRAPCNWNQRKPDDSVSRRRCPVTNRNSRISSHVDTGVNLCAKPCNKQREDSIEHQQQHEGRAEIRSGLILPEIQNDPKEGQAITKEENARNKAARAGKKVHFSEPIQVQFR